MDPILSSKLSNLPQGLQQKIDDLATTIERLVDRMTGVFQPNPPPGGGVVPPRWDASIFDSKAREV